MLSPEWRGGSEAAGEAARLMAPHPQSYFFCLFVWDAYHVAGTTCNDRRSLCNTFEWMRALQAPQQFHGRVLVENQGARPLEASKNLHLTVPNSGSNIVQQQVDGCAFFHVHCSTKSQGNPKGPKFSILKFLIRKIMCMFYSSSWIIFLKLRVTDQCQDRSSTLQHLSDFSKNVLFFTIS